MDIKYPDVTVQLSGLDGNVYGVVTRVMLGIRRAHGAQAAEDFKVEALNQSSYDDVLQLCMRTVEVQ